MQNDINKRVDSICKHYNVHPTDIARKKWANVPEFNYQEVISRILLSEGSAASAFPEISRGTVSSLLGKLFPDKITQKHTWDIHFLNLLGLRKCRNCGIQDITEFRYSKLDDKYRCRKCAANNKRGYYSERKEKFKEYAKEYNQNHRAEFRAYGLRRYIRTRRATPIWADMNIMNAIYAARKDGQHTDHIVPIQGRLVCGLHNHFNLRNISATENLTKGNSFDPMTYVHELP